MVNLAYDISDNVLRSKGEFIENSSLTGTTKAILRSATSNFESNNINENYNTFDQFGWHVNVEGDRWWSNPNNQVFGTENAGGVSPWYVYKQSNIYTTARKYAGKINEYGVHIYRPRNIGDSNTWGGIVIMPYSDSKLLNHKYRFSFWYRGYSNGYQMEVYQNTAVGWGTLGIGLPTPWYKPISAFDTDWEWRYYSSEYTVTSEYLNWLPGTYATEWSPTTQYGDWTNVIYNGYVYRKPSWTGVPTLGVPPDQEYPSIWDWRVENTPGILDVYAQIKIGFNYEPQGTRGTHVFIDDIQLTDITDNQTFKYNLSNSTWYASNISEGGMHIVAKGSAYVTQDKGDGSDVFAVEGVRYLSIDDTVIYNGNIGRGLYLTIINESTKTVDSNTLYDVYGSSADQTSLANALSLIPSTKVWVLTSFDAVGTNSALSTQMKNMGSKLYVDDGNLYSIFTGGGVRHPYAAVGRGQKIIKEDGSNASDVVYKRKGVIDIIV